MTVPWEEGIIGRTEAFMLDRFPIGKMLARAIPSSLVSISLCNAILPDEWGKVRANLWYFYIGRSGFAFKTPVIKFIRNVIIGFDPRYNAPPKFTPEGFTEYVTGTQGSKKNERKAITAHPVNYICRDEMSKLLGSRNQKYQSELGEYMSELWDGFIEGYYTRSHQYEGNCPVYAVAFMAGSEYFYELLDQTFFTQGLGNRPLWIVGEDRTPKKLDQDFFFSFGDEDEGLAQLRRTLYDDLKEIRNSSNLAFITDDANEIWREFQYRMATEAHKNKTMSLEGMLKMKLAFNALKLSMCYSAGRFNLKTGNVVFVDVEDMEQAIKDVGVHEKMWQLAMERWNVLKGDKPTPTHMSDKMKVISCIAKAGGRIQHATLLRKVGWSKDDMAKIIDTMISDGTILMRVRKGKTRPMRVYGFKKAMEQ